MIINYSVKKQSTWVGLPKGNEIKKYKSIHVVILRGNNYVYIHASPSNVKHCGSSMYNTRGAKGKEKCAEERMRAVHDQINLETNDYFVTSMGMFWVMNKEGDGIPRQSNDIDCDMFVLFFVKCMWRGFRIKPQLTAIDISNYRKRLYSYQNKGKKVKQNVQMTHWLRMKTTMR